jgi:prepilin peptidase CpaA
MQGLTLLLTATVVAASAWAVREDLLAHRIPNRLTGPLLAAGILLQFAKGGWSGIPDALLGALIGLAVLLPFYFIRAMGAGDVKLLAALGAVLGPYWSFVAGIETLIAGGAFAVIYVLSGAARAGLQRRSIPWRLRMHYAGIRALELRRARFPYAIAIAAGAICAVGQRGDLRASYELLAGLRT